MITTIVLQLANKYISHFDMADTSKDALNARRAQILWDLQNQQRVRQDLNNMTFMVDQGGYPMPVEVNSTLVSLASPKLRKLCVNPQGLAKLTCPISDVDLNTFRQVINYIYGREEGFRIRDINHAWQVNGAAKKFSLDGLVDFSQAYVSSRLNLENCLGILNDTGSHGNQKIRDMCLDLVKTDPQFILAHPDIPKLGLAEFTDVLMLVPASIPVLDAFLLWGQDKSVPQVEGIFPCIPWASFTSAGMKKLRKAKLLPFALEYKAMLRMLEGGRPKAVDNMATKLECVCELEYLSFDPTVVEIGQITFDSHLEAELLTLSKRNFLSRSSKIELYHMEIPAEGPKDRVAFVLPQFFSRVSVKVNGEDRVTPTMIKTISTPKGERFSLDVHFDPVHVKLEKSKHFSVALSFDPSFVQNIQHTSSTPEPWTGRKSPLILEASLDPFCLMVTQYVVKVNGDRVDQSIVPGIYRIN
eukprot:snap_masked-scaffold373_size192110-processed-gene-0.6 protein:Tk03505 transcript:snap_masked-scaffold373_size192110-processed-gene-0.6-mRNA-1 annotation:"hypothetical protein RirG_191850"